MSIKTESIKRVLRLAGVIPEETTVWLRSINEGKALHCMECGRFLLYRQHSILAIVQDDMSQVLHGSPLTIQCQKCGHIYKLNTGL